MAAEVLDATFRVHRQHHDFATFVAAVRAVCVGDLAFIAAAIPAWAAKLEQEAFHGGA